MPERWHKGGTLSAKGLGQNQKIFLRLLAGMLVLSLFSFGCSSSEKAFVEDEDTSVDETIEESTEITDMTDSPPVDEADPEEGPSLDDETISDEEVVEEIPCAWDVGWKKGASAWGTGTSRTEDARLGSHSEYDRFVLEFSADDPDPENYNVMWMASPMSPGGGPFPVDEPRGEVFLEVRVGATYLAGNAGDSYEGPDVLSGSSLINIQEAVNVGEFDGQIVWLLGANEANGFRVFQLEDPPRLVVDVCVVDASETKGADCLDSGMPPGLCSALFDFDYAGAHSEHAEAFGSGGCPALPDVSSDAFTTASYFVDLDGDGDNEEAFTYYETYDEGIYLRVINGVDKIDYLLNSGAYVPGGNAVVGAIDLQADDKPELFVTTLSGSPGGPRGVYLFQINECTLVTVQEHGTGSDFTMAVGYASAAGRGYGVNCVEGAPVLRQLMSNPDYDAGPPATTWFWTITTHELLSDNTMQEVSVSPEYSGGTIPWSNDFNDCVFE